MKAHDCNWHDALKCCINERCPLHRAMRSLAASLRDGAMLCAAFDLGWDACIESEDSLAAWDDDLQTQDEHDERLANLWTPGCGRSAT